MDTEEDISHRVRIEDLGGVIAQYIFPVLTPIGGIDNQCVRQPGVTQRLDRGNSVVNICAGCNIVAERFVGDIDQYIVFLSLQGAHKIRAGPVADSIRDIYCRA
jgi:hypothetical protein